MDRRNFLSVGLAVVTGLAIKPMSVIGRMASGSRVIGVNRARATALSGTLASGKPFIKPVAEDGWETLYTFRYNEDCRLVGVKCRAKYADGRLGPWVERVEDIAVGTDPMLYQFRRNPEAALATACVEHPVIAEMV